MTITSDLTSEPVPKWLKGMIDYHLSAFHRQDESLYAARVYFGKLPGKDGEDHVCEIELTAAGSSILVRRHAGNMTQAAEEALKELASRLKAHKSSLPE